MKFSKDSVKYLLLGGSWYSASKYCLCAYPGWYPPQNFKDRIPVRIRQTEASIPQPLADLIDKALIDNPELHFKSALTFKQALMDLKNKNYT